MCASVDAKAKPIPLRKRVRFQCETFAARLIAWMFPHFSRRAVGRLGRMLGLLGYYLLPAQRRVALANLDLAFGSTKSPAEKTRIARASAQNFGATMLTQFWAPRLTRDTLDKFVEVDAEGLRLVRDLRAKGRPIIFVTLHYGDWELLGLSMGFYEIHVTVVTKTMRNAGLETIFERLRAQSGNRIISSRHAGAKLLKALARGDGAALLIDQHVGLRAGGIWCDFFGVPALTTSMVARLALHSGAAIVGCRAIALPNGRSRIVYGPEIRRQPSGDKEADIQSLTQQCLQFCEQTIREKPESWLWSYKRWKVRPHQEQGRYPFYSRSLSS
jgi:KDO2-lipid IV(A) lauroyltransferase